MEQVPAEFEGARICYFDRKANVGLKMLQLKKEIIHPWFFSFCGLKSQCHPKESLKF